AAIEAADIVLMEDKLSALITAMKIARKTIWIAKENIIFALVIKIGMLIFGAFGFVNMWGAVFADVGVSVLCILNSIRALNVSKFKAEPLN
ncbi:cadmium-translocating P-type ATPase, partial [gut metagenome]